MRRRDIPGRIAGRLRPWPQRAPDAGATPEIAELQEKHDTGTIDWIAVDASGTPRQTLEHCQTWIAFDEAARGR